MYKPAAFLISSAALTSIFSFFFGGYFRERERAYRLWLMIVAYGKEIPTEREKINICSELESRDRMFYQAVITSYSIHYTKLYETGHY